LAGAWAGADLAPLRSIFASHAVLRRPISIELAGVTRLGPGAIALLSLLYGWQLEIGAEWEILSPSGAAQRALRLSCADYLLAPHGTPRPSA
jgi:hypothetical protein